jgi:hypothetical protein
MSAKTPATEGELVAATKLLWKFCLIEKRAI